MIRDVSYDEEETRGFVRRSGLALALTFGAIVFVVVTISLIAVVPAVLDALGAAGAVRVALEVARGGCSCSWPSRWPSRCSTVGRPTVTRRG